MYVCVWVCVSVQVGSYPFTTEPNKTIQVRMKEMD